MTLCCVVPVKQSPIYISWMANYTLALGVPTGCKIQHFPRQRGWSSSMMKLNNFSVIPLAFTLSVGSLSYFWNASVSVCCLSFCLACVNSCSFTWCFYRCLIKFVVLHTAARLPPLGILALHALHVAVSLFGVSRLKYLQTKDMFVLIANY